MGERAIERANRAGVPAYFMNPSLGEGIIRRMPDGRLERVRLEAGKFIAIETLRLPD
jgi:hypothetical protein